MEWQAIVTGLTVIGFVYKFLRNFKNDINKKIDSVEKHMEAQDIRVLAALNSQDERIFQLATGKSLRDAMMEAKRKSDGI